MSFVHLHVHTQYSLLQGATALSKYLERAKTFGMPALAMTDAHNLFGAIDFVLAAEKAGLKAIIGCEINYVPVINPAATPTAKSQQFLHHLVLLCKNLNGYRGLCKMISESYLRIRTQDGTTGLKPVVDRALLSQYGDDLVVLSGCLRGEVPYLYSTGHEEEALKAIEWYRSRFKGDFYLELVDSGMPEQVGVNQFLARAGERLGVPLVGTSDCHYLEPGMGESHEVLQCIEYARNLDFDRPKSLVPHEFYLKSPDEMRERLAAYPGAFENTLAIAEKCDVQFQFKDEKGRAIYHVPLFRPEGVAKTDAFDLIAYFKKQAREGLQRRFKSPQLEHLRVAADWAEKKAEYEARLEQELTMIEKTGFAGYFLIVSDFILWAKSQGIPVGPGRGSGAGSLVAYSLFITDIDPIEFKLLFERFINPERISMPDFDIDFCQDRRQEVIDYVTRKYGNENVVQIITFGKLQARAVVKDVGRVLGYSFAETNQITDLIPSELDITLTRALSEEPRLRERAEVDPRAAKLLEYSLNLEGLYRNAGVHAAGVIITEMPVVNYCPIYVGRDGAVVTQFDKDKAEAVGLVKFDFLGLKTLTVIDHAVKLIPHEAGFELDRMNLKDPKVFALISSGDTDGIFQVESSGMKDLCQRIQPSSLEDITAINALYRPGPLGSGMVDDFIDRKHGRKPIVYEVPALESILKETYGVILYQEQVMQIARELAGYSLGQADLLRRAMGKKKPEEMAKHKDIFVKGATERGLDAKKAESIFDLMAKFAEYGFNKSHSAAYGLITYQTAFLKTHFPSEFMAALMTTEMGDTDKLAKYISDARAHQIPVKSPDVNLSGKRFSVERGSKPEPIRFGLEAIKGVGSSAVEAILEARETKGPFKDVVDFVKRVPSRKANKKVLESLTISGALDTLIAKSGTNRPSVLSSIEGLTDFAVDEQEEAALGQSSLFDAFTAEDIKGITPISNLFKAEADWPLGKRLTLEKQVVGLYLSAHPLESWQKIFEDWLGWNLTKLKGFAAERRERQAKAPPREAAFGMEGGGRPFRTPKPEVRVAGLITETKEIMTKKGARMGFATLEDLTTRVECVLFPEAYAQSEVVLKKAAQEAEPVLIHAELEFMEDSPKLLVRSIVLAEEAHKNRVEHVVLSLNPDELKGEQLRELKQSLLKFPGKCQVKILFKDSDYSTRLELPKQLQVAGTPQLVSAINNIFGRSVVMLK